MKKLLIVFLITIFTGQVAFAQSRTITLKQGAAPSNPPATFTTLYINSSGILTVRQSNGTEETLNQISTTDDLAEGITNLYFTDTRARAALSGVTGVSYNSGTGAFSLNLTYSPTYDLGSGISQSSPSFSFNAYNAGGTVKTGVLQNIWNAGAGVTGMKLSGASSNYIELYDSGAIIISGTNADLASDGTLTLDGQLISNVTTGTPALVIDSTTNIPNLNASSLNGATFAAPGPIGSGTANTGAFTTLAANTLDILKQASAPADAPTDNIRFYFNTTNNAWAGVDDFSNDYLTPAFDASVLIGNPYILPMWGAGNTFDLIFPATPAAGEPYFLRVTGNGVAATGIGWHLLDSTDLTVPLATPPTIGGTTPGLIFGTTITATSAFSGPLNGTVGATTPNTGAFTTISTTGDSTLASRVLIGAQTSNTGAIAGTGLNSTFEISNPASFATTAYGLRLAAGGTTLNAGSNIDIKISNSLRAQFTSSNFALTGAMSMTGQLTNTIATGTAPFVISSTTPVSNLTLSADTQIPTISTAGKVSDSALSSNVDLLNLTQTITATKTFVAPDSINAAIIVKHFAAATNPTAIALVGSDNAVKFQLGTTSTFGVNLPVLQSNLRAIWTNLSGDRLFYVEPRNLWADSHAAKDIQYGSSVYFNSAGAAMDRFGISARAVHITTASLTGGAAPDGSAILQIDSTTDGVLIPRMTGAQRDAIGSPATSLRIYNTDTNKHNYYNSSAWVALLDSNDWAVPGTIGSTTPNTGAFTTLTTTGNLNFGGSASSFPAIKRSGDELIVRLADDSVNTTITVAGIRTAYVAKVANYTATVKDNFISVDATGAGGDVTILLPTSVGNAGLELTIKTIGTANNVIVDGNGAETIDGTTTKTLTTQWTSITVVSDNANWFIK